MFFEKSFTRKTKVMIVLMVVHRKDIKKQKVKSKKNFWSKDLFEINES